MPIVLKSGSLNLLEPCGLLQARNGIALHLAYTRITDRTEIAVPILRYFFIAPKRRIIRQSVQMFAISDKFQ
jgi:hypothetical protein